MADPIVVHIEPATPPGSAPRLHVPYRIVAAVPVALSGPVTNPIITAAGVLIAEGEDPARLILKRRRGTDLNEWSYTLAEASQLTLENEQPVPPSE